ncbi:MAG TPA: hypothetical protein VJN48_09815 [Terriglobales bacterium]|nr:hypothetical protein [Terriglobales bacterium]
MTIPTQTHSGARSTRPAWFRAAFICALVFILTSAALVLARSDRRVALLQNYSTVFFLALIGLLLWVKKRCLSDANDGSQGLPFPPPLLLLFPALAYLPVLWTYFVSDDFEHLQLARLPLLPFLGEQLTRGQVTGSGYHLFFRPLGFASLFFDYRLFHYWAPGYHLVNLALHLVVVVGVYFLSQGLGLSRKTSAMAALLFSVAPVTVQPVTYIAARFDLLATALGIWALVLYLRFRKSGSAAAYALALLLFFAATFAKESIYVLPLLLVWLELVLVRGRNWKAVAGFFVVAAATFIYRWRVLHGIGGYQAPGGSPAVLEMGRKALAAVFLRAPAETLLGYNWHQPPAWHVIAIAAATTAVLLSLLLISRPGPQRRRLAWFALGWMVIAVLPAHFLLWTADPALLWSRVLYISAIGMAILLATLLSGVADVRLRRVWTSLLLLCFLLGMWHNLSAWRSNSRITRQFLAALPRVQPSPPRDSEFVISDMPIELCGVRFFLTGLTPAVQLAYGRPDLSARRPFEPALRPNLRAIDLRWTGQPPDFVAPAQPSSANTVPMKPSPASCR